MFGSSTATTTAAPTVGAGGGGGGLFGGGGGGSGGGLFGGLGGKPNPENANKNVFGSTSTFGSATSASSGKMGPSRHNTGSPLQRNTTLGPAYNETQHWFPLTASNKMTIKACSL